MTKFISCVVRGPSHWFFHFCEENVIAWTHIRLVQWMFQNLPLPAAQEVRDSSSSVTPCTVIKKNGVLLHQEYLFSLHHWTKMALPEHAVVSSLPWRYSVVQYYSINVICHNEHHLYDTLCRVHFLWPRRTGMLPFIWLAFQVWFVWASPASVHSNNSPKKVINFPLVPVQQGLCNCIAVPLLHLGNFMGYPTRCKFGVSQNVMKNMEHSSVTYCDFRC